MIIFLIAKYSAKYIYTNGSKIYFINFLINRRFNEEMTCFWYTTWLKLFLFFRTRWSCCNHNVSSRRVGKDRLNVYTLWTMQNNPDPKERRKWRRAEVDKNFFHEPGLNPSFSLQHSTRHKRELNFDSKIFWGPLNRPRYKCRYRVTFRYMILH